MRFSILTKFFLSFLVSGVLLVGLMVGAMQFYTFRNFSEYVDRMELDNLSGLLEALSAEYSKHGDWAFIRHNHEEWIKIFIRTGLIERQNMVSGPLGGAAPFSDPDRPYPLHLHHPSDQAHAPLSVSSAPGGGMERGNRFRSGVQPSPHAPMKIPVLRGPGPLEVGPRLSLFDADYNLVMGRPRSTRGHLLKPVTVQDKTVGYLALKKLGGLSHPLDQFYFKRQKKGIYLVGGLFFIISMLISYILASHLLSPIKKMSSATRMLGKRRFDTQIEINSTDELGQLADDFNTMSRRLGEYELKQKQWLSDISHELRTPMSILIGEIDAVQDGIRPFDFETLKSIQSEIFHLQKLIDGLHTLSMEEAKNFQHDNRAVRIIPLLGETIERFSDSFSKKGIAISTHWEGTENKVIMGDPERMGRLFSNLLRNTYRYTDTPGKLIVSGQADESYILIIFEDTSPGVPDDKIKRIFDRLFRADPSRDRRTGGSGIGLAISKNIVESHGGVISAASSRHGGLKIVISLPIVT